MLDKAATLFASQGFAATSLKDVADAVGLQRSSIYYYYPNKDALLKELIQGVTLPVAKIFAEVEKEGLSPLAKIREVVRRLVLWVADPHTHFRLMDRSEAELPDTIAIMHKKAKRQVLGEMIKLVEAAVLAGEARAVDLRIGALLDHRHGDVDGLVVPTKSRTIIGASRERHSGQRNRSAAAHAPGQAGHRRL